MLLVATMAMARAAAAEASRFAMRGFKVHVMLVSALS
jgi:hypothetical protein